jgi:phytoene synthase
VTDAAYCKKIVERHARAFSMASRLLPREKRRGVYAIYAFCRTADDIVDVAPRGGGHGAALSKLARYRESFGRALVAPSDDPVLRELARTIDRFDVPRGSFDTLLDGVERDLSATRYLTWGDLHRYCQQVASSVGEMCAAVFGLADGADPERAIAHARTLGVAMQLTNILRDVGEDARHERCYLPEEDLANWGLSREDVLSGRALIADSSWRSVMAFEIERARQLYREAIPGIEMLASDAQSCALACAGGYAQILTAIEHNRYDTFSRRAVVKPAARLRVLIRSWLRFPPDIPSPAIGGQNSPRPSHVAA